MPLVKNTTRKPIIIRVGRDSVIVPTTNRSTRLKTEMEELKKNKVIASYFDDGLLVEITKKKSQVKTDERIELEEEATSLGLTFPANIKDDTLATKIEEAKQVQD